MPAVHPAFQCVVMSPTAKLLDCMATSVIFPAHDGQVGIWANHVPMLCQLDVGIVKIMGVPPDVDTPPGETTVLIDCGFALLAKNVLTITAFDAISTRDTKTEKISQLIEKTEQKLTAGLLTPRQRSNCLKKISLLKQLAGLA